MVSKNLQAIRFITVFLMYSFLYAQDLMTEMDYKRKKQTLSLDYGDDLNEFEASVLCNFDDREELKRKEEELRENIRTELNRQLLIFVKSSYESTTEGDETKSGTKFYRRLETETIRMPMPGIEYIYSKDG
ncbi:uncharacterized protein METZ01_LOCUS385238, partial [marine metagenome]